MAFAMVWDGERLYLALLAFTEITVQWECLCNRILEFAVHTVSLLSVMEHQGCSHSHPDFILTSALSSSIILKKHLLQLIIQSEKKTFLLRGV